MNRQPPTQRDFPYARIAPLVMSRIAEGGVWAVILPYINEQVLSFGVDPSSVGFWSGLIESGMMITEALCSPFWAVASDKYGRKSMVLVGLAILAMTGTGYGFCSTLSGVIFLRFLLGFGGAVGAQCRTILGESCGKEHMVKGYALFSPAIMIGAVAGAFLGGSLSRPADRIPYFSDSTLFRTYPYALPNLICGIFGVITLITGAIFMKETLDPELRNRRRSGRGGNESGLGEKSSGAGYGGLTRHTPFLILMTIYAVQQVMSFSFETLLPLFCFSPTSHLGLSLSTPLIGRLSAISALFAIFSTFFIFPFVQKRLGSKTMMRLCLWSYVVLAGCYPLLRYLRGEVKDEGERDQGLSLVFWVVMIFQLILKRFADLCGPLMDCSVPGSLEHKDQLAMANSLIFSSGGVGRAIGPIVFGAIFSYSSAGAPFAIFRRNTVWLALILIGSIIGTAVLLPGVEIGGEDDSESEMKGEGGGGAGEYELVAAGEEEEEDEQEDEARAGLRGRGSFEVK